jgi:hypothetical protein
MTEWRMRALFLANGFVAGVTVTLCVWRLLDG